MSRKQKRLFLTAICLLPLAAVMFDLSLYLRIGKINRFVTIHRTDMDKSAVKTVDEIADSIISRMTLEEKVGQLIMINYYGGDQQAVYTLVSNLNLGGVMLKSDNVKPYTYDQIKVNNKELLASSVKIPLIISIDQEGGNVARLNGIIKSYPFPADVYEKDGEEGIRSMADYMSSKLRDLNINVNFSPVVDIVYKTNSVINRRSFSSNATVNAELASVYLNVSAENHVIAVLKHFPGYGNVGLDPHQEVSIDPVSTLSELSEPFIKISGVQMIMSSHVIYTRYDDRPGTLSRPVLSYLRQSGYSNVIITDDIQMKCITKLFDYKKASLEAIKAGCDIVLSVTQNQKDWRANAVDLYQYLNNAVKNGSISEERFNESVKRVLRMKLSAFTEDKWGILDDSERKSLALSFEKKDNTRIVN